MFMFISESLCRTLSSTHKIWGKIGKNKKKWYIGKEKMSTRYDVPDFNSFNVSRKMKISRNLCSHWTLQDFRFQCLQESKCIFWKHNQSSLSKWSADLLKLKPKWKKLKTLLYGKDRTELKNKFSIILSPCCTV